MDWAGFGCPGAPPNLDIPDSGRVSAITGRALTWKVLTSPARLLLLIALTRPESQARFG